MLVILVAIHLLAIGLVGYWAWLLNVMGQQKPKRRKLLAQEHRITYNLDPKRTPVYGRSSKLEL